MGLASVITDIAPLYHGPGPETGRVDEALYGMSVQIIEQNEQGWCYVRTEHNTEGYTPCTGLEQNADVAAAWRRYKKATVLAPYIDLQSAPNASAGSLATLPRGGIIVTLGKPGENGWQKVGLPSGAVGYTRASYLGEVITDWTQLSPADMRWNIVETALSYNGAAWRTGGRTPQGIDDVGLVAMSYQLNGVNIWRENYFKPGLAAHQIKRDDMDEGDILYFPEQVGLYIGNGQFVHATQQPGIEGVVVGSLRPKDDAYRPDLAEHIVAVASLF